MNDWRFIVVSCIALLAGMNIPAWGQIVSNEKTDAQVADSIREELDNRPYFSLYKDT